MLQRIQSIFLALAAFCSFGLFGTDAAETDAPVASSAVFADAQYTVLDSPVLIGGVVAAGILLLLTIFMFRNRKLQTTLCTVAILLTVAYTAYGVLVFLQDPASAQAALEFGIILPVLVVVFTALAARYIRKDERLVRSADRLR